MKTNIQKNKAWQIIGVSVLCAVLVLGAVLAVLFGMNHSSEDLNVSKDMSEQDDLVISQWVSQGITLMSGVATTASDGSTSQTIVATAYDSNNVEASTKFKWSAFWASDSSDFATGKDVSDYLLLVPSEDTKSCEVIAKAKFGEVIIVQVNSLDNPNAFASVEVNYVRRIFDISNITINNVMDSVKYYGNTSFNICPYGCEHSFNEYKNTIDGMNWTYFSAYTIRTGTSIKLKKFFVTWSANDLYTNKLLSKVPTLNIEKSKNVELNFAENADGTYSFHCKIEDLFPGRTAEEYASISNFLLDNKTLSCFEYSLVVDLIYNGNVIQTFDLRNIQTSGFNGWFTVHFDTSALTYSVVSVSTDKSIVAL